MSGAIQGYTSNFKLLKVNFNWITWHDYEHANWDTVDALLYSITAINNIQGVWSNDLAVIVGDRYIDALDGTIWEVLISHTTATTPITFTADRTANPLNWVVITPLVPISKGAWANNTLYQKNDYVELTGLVAIAKVQHTSNAAGTIDTDIANWTYLVDIRTELAQTTADVVSTNADVVLTNADVVSTNADAASTAADALATSADVISTANDVITTSADALTTTNDVITTGNNATLTSNDVVTTNADVVTTNADVVSTNTDVIATGNDVIYAEEWAKNAEDAPVSVLAGGDGATTFSALHWAAKALGFVKDFISGTDTPASFTGQALKILRVNAGETAVEFAASTHLTWQDIYPIGAVFISVVSTSPATLFGGTWSVIATGRTLIGIDSGDVDFDAVEEIGGAKTHTLITSEIPSHTHTANHNHTASSNSTGSHTHVVNGGSGSTQLTDNTGGASVLQINSGNSGSGGSHSHTITVDTNNFSTGGAGSGSAHTIVQPYFVTYMWKRVT